MSHLNRIQHYLSTEGIRITFADVMDAAKEAQEIHHLPSLSAVIMGKVINAAAILAMDFKNHEGGVPEVGHQFSHRRHPCGRL